MLTADFFMGNVFSSFSGTVRLSQLAARPPLAARQLAAAVYYNALLATTAADVAPLETRRFGLYPGVFHRGLYEGAGAPQFAHLLAMQRRGRCLHKWSPDQQQCFNQTAPPPAVVGIQLLLAARRLAAAGGAGGAAVVVEGGLNTSAPSWFPQLEVRLGGRPAGTLVANAVDRAVPGFSNFFVGEVQGAAAAGGVPVNVTVCAADVPHVCSAPLQLA